jgi:hypothetical protein
MIIDSLKSNSDKSTVYNNGTYSPQHLLASDNLFYCQDGNFVEHIQDKSSDCECNKNLKGYALSNTDNIGEKHKTITHSIPRPVPVFEFPENFSNNMPEQNMIDSRDIPFPIGKT